MIKQMNTSPGSRYSHRDALQHTCCSGSIATGAFRPQILLFILIIPFLTSCGSLPGPGPSPEQIARRSQGVEVQTFKTHDNRELAYVVHRPDQAHPRGAAFIYLHGIESHSGWFDLAAEHIAAHGYPVFSLDRRGSGLNRENRGFISGNVERGTNLIEDIKHAVGIARASGKVDEIYLIGLSWGGKYAMAYDATYPDQVDGMILVTPGMKPKVDLTLGEKISVLIDSLFASTRQHRIPIEPEMFTTNPEHLQYIKDDPLKLNTVSASFLMQSLRMDRLVKKKEDGKHPPMLVILAGKDRIIDNEATRKFVTRDPNRSVKVVEYPDQTHSIQLDAPARLASEIERWISTLPDKH
jgi:alpha-beta hydrolase superfamily lysophospholipase